MLSCFLPQILQNRPAIGGPASRPLAGILLRCLNLLPTMQLLHSFFQKKKLAFGPALLFEKPWFRT